MPRNVEKHSSRQVYDLSARQKLYYERRMWVHIIYSTGPACSPLRRLCTDLLSWAMFQKIPRKGSWTNTARHLGSAASWQRIMREDTTSSTKRSAHILPKKANASITTIMTKRNASSSNDCIRRNLTAIAE